VREGEGHVEEEGLVKVGGDEVGGLVDGSARQGRLIGWPFHDRIAAVEWGVPPAGILIRPACRPFGRGRSRIHVIGVG